MVAAEKPSELTLHGNVAENWRRFKQRLMLYLEATEKATKPDKLKVAILLNFIGEEALEVFNTFHLKEDEAENFDLVINKFDDFCEPKKNVILKDSNFFQRPRRMTKKAPTCAPLRLPLEDSGSKRLPYGLNSASEVFQRCINNILSGLQGTACYMDDILIYGSTMEEHNRNLETVLRRLEENNVKLNAKKQQIAVDKVNFLGHIISRDGIAIQASRAEAIQKLKRPENKTEVQRFLGMVTYLGKFIPNLSDKTAPLRKLISNKSEWKFGGEENDCFEKLKDMVSNAPILTFFDPTKPITISSDASQYGIGTVLMQGGHAIEYASFSLNATQRKYAQIEKELLAIVFGCERFQYYIWGNDVIVETDHKPLLSIVKKPLEKLSPRLQRMVLRLMRFQISLKFTPGKNMFVADHLSRDPLKDEVDTSYLEGQTESVHMLLVTTDEKIKRLQKETHEDHTLIQLIEYAKNGWPKYKTMVCDEAKPYWQFQDEIHVSDGIVYKGNCIVVPSTLRKEILQVVHSSHQGIAASKEKARSAFYWPGMITQVENEVEKCRTCQEYSRKNPEESRIAHEIPEFPWEKIAVDFMEVSGTSSILVVDYHSKFVEIRKLSSKRETETILQLKTIFRTHGIPRTLVSDNGPPFNSTGFKNFAQKYEFKHQTSSPKYPRSNGQVERTIQTIKGLIIKAVKSGRDPNLALMEFNNTPKYDLPSPTQMLMGRSVRTLSTYTRQQLKPLFDTTKNYQKLRDHQQKYAGSPKRILRPLEVGDNIMLQERHRKWVPATVTAKHETPRSYMVKTPSGSEYRRNRSHLRPRKFSVEDSAQQFKVQAFLDLKQGQPWMTTYKIMEDPLPKTEEHTIQGRTLPRKVKNHLLLLVCEPAVVEQCEAGSNWDDILPMVALAIRTTEHSSTGFTPAKLVFGHDLRLPQPFQEAGQSPVSEDLIAQTAAFYERELTEEVEKIREVVRQTYLNEQEEARIKFENKRLRTFNNGDLVLVERMHETKGRHKFEPSWSFQMKLVLIENDLWSLINPGEAKPDPSDLVATKLFLSREDFTTATVKRRLLAEAERRSSNLPKDVGAMVVNASSKPIETEKQFKAKVVCFKCGGKGHYARECRKKGKNEQRPTRFDQNKGVNMSAMCNTLFGATAETWIIDSGATHHMTPKRDYFTCLKECTSNMSSFTIANGSSIEACGIGTVSANIVGHKGDASNMIAQNTLYVPNMRHSVLSVLQMIENGRKVVFNKSGCYIMDMKDQNDHVSLASECKEELTLELWHKRLMHVNAYTIAKMAKNQSVRGLVCSPAKSEKCEDCSPAKPEKCEDCLIGKSYRLPFLQHSHKEEKEIMPLDLVHADLMGPLDVLSWGGAKYVLTIIDESTRYTSVFFLKNKGGTLGKVKEWIQESEKQTSRKLKRIRTDNGLEFCSKEWDTFCTSVGIVHEHTMTYTPQQNGVAERMNRTLLDLVRSTISGSGLPKASWAELTYTAAYVRNRVLNNHNGESTPYELWTGNKPSLKHTRAIGCQVFVHIPRQVRKSKLERRAVKGNLVGYALRGRGYRVWIPEMKKVVESRDCVFKESDVSRNDSNREVLPSVEHYSYGTQREIEENPVSLLDQEDVIPTEEDSHNEDTVKPSPTRSHPMILRNQRNAQNSIELLSTEVNKWKKPSGHFDQATGEKPTRTSSFETLKRRSDP
ncbi:K02A2.6-like [Cordylochernes scorpioides]|uniref:RNA-directed DNA polymerase n=1 Tax=Cordylochernes scorpioides TaxID=51811 RepID=A0ABY6K459_9ARAC|nr:K02A2.6-like [Cordylochernes scorpioides]